jgi:hypothetical protein
MSMPADGSCAYHLAGMALYASRHPDHPDIDQWTSDVAGAVRSIVIDNFLNIRDQFLTYLDNLPVSLRSSQVAHWENMMSEGSSAESFVEAAVEQTKWGGSIEMALAMISTCTAIIILQADQISDSATRIDVEGAVQPAMLQGLTEGARKTHHVFAILRKGHYHLGYVRKEGVKRGLFKAGDESESAKELIIEFLKSTHSSASQQKRKKGRGKRKQESMMPVRG